MPSLSELRTQYPLFIYESCSWTLTPSGLEIAFRYSIPPDHVFEPTFTIPGVTTQHITALGRNQLNLLVFHLGMVELLSYWKTTCSPTIHIAAGPMIEPQLEWWKSLLLHGMGEYFFVNQIDFTAPSFLALEAVTQTSLTVARLKPVSPEKPRTFIPVGGGKDSAVTLELLKQQSPPPTCLLLNEIPSALRTVQASGIADQILLERTLDPHLLELNQQGYLNGHTPFSALLAFASLLTAALFEYQFIALSNERSSNEGNTEFHGQVINHQYSKTYEFERAFQEYVQEYLIEESTASDSDSTQAEQDQHSAETTLLSPHYFSFLRPLYELQIAGLFSQYPQYHSVFRSCNRGQKTNTWCGDCPKCLFAYLMLFPFLGQDRLTEIFGENLLEKPSLTTTALELVGAGEQKPLECVGTHEESLVACYLAREWYHRHELELPAVLKTIETQVLSKEVGLPARTHDLLSAWNPEHSLPPQFADHLQPLVENLAKYLEQ